jgi:hypothetical protein
MRAKGITYDTGFVHRGVISRKRFDPEQVERELRIIRDDLHCTAVRVSGGDPGRIELAAGSPSTWAWRSGSRRTRWS